MCLCDDGWGGPVCNNTRPTGWISEAADSSGTWATCPDADMYDVCSGRGACSIRNVTISAVPSSQVYCKCDHGWFGNASYLGLYMNGLFNTGLADAWTDPNGWRAQYAREHQCLFWQGHHIGDQQSHHYVGLGADRAAVNSEALPAYPWSCTDTRIVVLDNRSLAVAGALFAGPDCASCPACSQGGTVSCVRENALNDTTSMQCSCELNFHGDTCELVRCPVNPVNGHVCNLHGTCMHNMTQASETYALNSSAAWPSVFVTVVGTTYRDDPLLAWDSTYIGMCTCDEGWGSRDGSCTNELCKVDQTTGKVCGHGHCTYSDCANYSRGVLQPYTGNEAALCMGTCNLNCATLSFGVACADCNASCTGGGRVVNQSLTWATACDVGTCTCFTGWTTDSDGLCTQRQCPLDDAGLECGGLLIVSGGGIGAAEVGQNVCDRFGEEPVCQCWKAIADLTPSLAFATGHYNGDRQACEMRYNQSQSCIYGGGAAACDGHGVCVAPGCSADAALGSWVGCTDPAARASRPSCVCTNMVYEGAWCQLSKCSNVLGDTPCRAISDATIATGVCTLHDDGTGASCVCNSNSSHAYMGRNCEIEARDCLSIIPGNNLLCSGHGVCDYHNTSGPTCDCDSGYTGATCQNATICGDNCPHDRGRCIDGICECFLTWDSTNCTQDRCAMYGATRIDRDTCNCTAVGGIMYPNVLRDVQPYESFKGCRKACPTELEAGSPFWGQECGPWDSFNYTRCRTVVPVNSTTAVTCSCGLSPGLHPLTGLASSWITKSTGVCSPKCLHCPEVGGVCNSTPSAFDGTYCNKTKCTRPHSTWNTTSNECLCSPSWMFSSSDNCRNNVSRCTPSPFSMDPVDDGGQTCQCTFPLRSDLDPTSPTYRLCVSACGAYGNASTTGSGSCVCDRIHSGTWCNVSLCASPFEPSLYEDICDCHNTPQWTTRFCNTSRCHGGSARTGFTPESGSRVPARGCVCYPTWEGEFCEIHRCGHGFPGGTGPTDACVCDDGWAGDDCRTNRCAAEGLVDPVALGGGSYSCACGPAGTLVGGACVATCVNGVLHSNVNRSGLVCLCEPPWFGDTCSQHPCTDTTRMQPTVVGATSGPYVCKDKYINDGSVACTRGLSCAQFTARHTQWKQDSIILGNRTFIPSRVSQPIQNPFSELAAVPCGCDDSRYIPWSMGTVFVGCVLDCVVANLDPNPDAYGTTIFADYCVCNPNITFAKGGQGDLCIGSLTHLAVAAGVVPAGVREDVLRSSLKTWEWSVLGGTLLVFSVVVTVVRYCRRPRLPQSSK
ncbi:MAG: hypothetical protein JKY23_00270 [Nitrospinaceae bacterium]|nr:hypothetical protein [Nitrospinaceae bacterium]